MLVMPSNNSGAHKLAEDFPGRLGLLISPRGERDPRGLPWAMDNGRFASWSRSGFSSEACEILEADLDLSNTSHFLDLVVWANGRKPVGGAHLCKPHRKQPKTRPEWVVVPDVPGNAEATLEAFYQWAPWLMGCGFTLALAVQDGMSPRDVPDGVVCFLGGSREWKWANVERFGAECERMHVGRVNGYADLWRAHRAGAESCDGTGFFRGRKAQLEGLLQYLRESSDELVAAA